MAPLMSEAYGLLLMALAATVAHLAARTRGAFRRLALHALGATGAFVALSSVPLALGAVASGGTRAILAAFATPHSIRRRSVNALALASLLVGFAVLVLSENAARAATPGARRSVAAEIHRRFSSVAVLSHLSLSLLAMLGALSWIADARGTDSGALELDVPTAERRDAELHLQCAFASLAGGAGACALVFEKSVAELVLIAGARGKHPVDDSLVALLLLLAWTALAFFESWWQQSALPSDAQSPCDNEPVVLKCYLASWVLYAVLQGTVVFGELRSASLTRALVICFGTAAIAGGLLSLKFPPRPPRLRLLSDSEKELSIELTPLLAAAETLLAQKDELHGSDADTESAEGMQPTYRPPIFYKVL